MTNARRSFVPAGCPSVVSAAAKIWLKAFTTLEVGRCRARYATDNDLIKSEHAGEVSREREFEPECLAPHHRFELRLTARDRSSLKNSAWNLSAAHRCD